MQHPLQLLYTFWKMFEPLETVRIPKTSLSAATMIVTCEMAPARWNPPFRETLWGSFSAAAAGSALSARSGAQRLTRKEGE